VIPQDNRETINLINQDQNDQLHLDLSIPIDQRWILLNKNLNLDHIEVWENPMEEQKIDNKKSSCGHTTGAFVKG
jgi:hypothetical protein